MIPISEYTGTMFTVGNVKSSDMGSSLGRIRRWSNCLSTSYIAVGLGLQVLMISAAVLADTVQQTVLQIAVTGQVDYASLQSQARAMANTALTNGFAQDPTVQQQTVTVMASRNGEVVPLLQVTVSRSQWLTTPQVEQWANQYSSAYALVLRQGGEPTTLAQAPSVRSIRSDSLRLERALDSRTLPGQVAQQYLSELD